MQLGFFFDQTRCSGCFTCVIACRQWHSVDHEAMQLRRVETIENGIYPDPKVSFLSISCLHCQSPSCMGVCPTSAIAKREEDGVVTVDAGKCEGALSCGFCKDACPYGIPQFNPDHEFVMEKCDFCLDRLDQGKRPICVDACPMHALDVAPLNELERRHGQGKEALGFIYSEEANPSVILRSRS